MLASYSNACFIQISVVTLKVMIINDISEQIRSHVHEIAIILSNFLDAKVVIHDCADYFMCVLW